MIKTKLSKKYDTTKTLSANIRKKDKEIELQNIDINIGEQIL